MMKMRKGVMLCAVLMLACTMLACTNASMAAPESRSMDFELAAGSSSVAGSVSYIRPLYNGYAKIGVSGVNGDDDSTSYQWAGVHMLVGSDTLSPGLQTEVGLKAVFGSAEENSHDGDVGVLAFTGRVGYAFPKQQVAIPLEIFGGLSYAPGPLSYMETESYMDMMVGVGIRIIEQACLQISFHQYNIDMEEGPGSWELEDSQVRFGMTLRF